jgi:hypothetical protein
MKIKIFCDEDKGKVAPIPKYHAMKAYWKSSDRMLIPSPKITCICNIDVRV